MSLEVKDILSYLGIQADDMDKFKAEVGSRFLTREAALTDDEIKGTIRGEYVKMKATEIQRKFKDHGITLTPDQAKASIEEMVAAGLAAQSTLLNTEIETLRKKAGEPTEALKEAEERFKKAQERADAEAAAKAALQSQLEAKDQEFGTFKRTFKRDNYVQELIKGLPYSDTATDLVKRGFVAHISDKYVIDLDDKDEPYIADAKTKARLTDPNKVSSFLSPADVLKRELEEQKLLKVVDAPPAQKPYAPAPPPEFDPNGHRQPTRQAHPNAQRV